MARARPLAELSPAYRRRIERAIAKAEAAGQPAVSRSAARGHGVREGKTESQRRREREKRDNERFGKLTSADRSWLKRWMDKAIHRAPSYTDRKEALKQAQALMTKNGRAWFQAQLASARGTDIAAIEMGVESGEGFPDAWWYFYH